MTYRKMTTRFLDEFGQDIAELATKDRGHAVKVGADYEDIVRIYIEMNGFEYWSAVNLYDTEMGISLGELCEELGLSRTEENMAAVKARLIKADLWET